MASEYTPNYNLDKYVGTDKPNLRDQYNSAMDKIDAQFVVIENDHTETGNQISAINTNISAINTNITRLGERVTTAEGKVTAINTDITRLGERVTTAEGKVTAVEGQIGQTSTELAEVKTAADNAMRLASANEGGLATLDSKMAQVQQGVANLQGVTRSQVLYDASNLSTASAGGYLSGASGSWEKKDVVLTLTSAIPDWANWLDVYLNEHDLYWKTGASAFADTVEFMHNTAVKTFPLNEYYVDDATIKTRRVTKFSLSTEGLGVAYTGMPTIGGSFIPFMINGTTLTQKGMGLAASDGMSSGAPFTNGLLGTAYTYDAGSSVPKLQNMSSSAKIYKIVARA